MTKQEPVRCDSKASHGDFLHVNLFAFDCPDSLIGVKHKTCEGRELNCTQEGQCKSGRLNEPAYKNVKVACTRLFIIFLKKFDL